MGSFTGDSCMGVFMGNQMLSGCCSDAQKTSTYSSRQSPWAARGRRRAWGGDIGGSAIYSVTSPSKNRVPICRNSSVCV